MPMKKYRFKIWLIKTFIEFLFLSLLKNKI